MTTPATSPKHSVQPGAIIGLTVSCYVLLLGVSPAQQQDPTSNALTAYAATREKLSRVEIPVGRYVYTRHETGLLDPDLDRGFTSSQLQPRDFSELCILNEVSADLFQVRTVSPAPAMPHENLKSAIELPGRVSVRRRDGNRQLELSIPNAGHRPQFSSWDLGSPACTLAAQPIQVMWPHPPEVSQAASQPDLSRFQTTDLIADKGTGHWYARLDDNRNGATVVMLEAEPDTGEWLPARMLSIRLIGLQGHRYVSVNETSWSGWIVIDDGFRIPTQRSFRQADLPEKALPTLEPREMLPAAIGGLLDSATFKLEAKFELLGYDPDRAMPEAPKPGPGMYVFEYVADAKCAVSLVAAYGLGPDGERTPIEIGVPR